MVGYPESITDPSYEGQILVITFPLVGNYGVPPRDTIVDDLPAYFESSRIHIAGLVVATYSEEYSHHLASSALGDWLQEQGIPGIWGVDTRALTKRIRVKGSMLGRLRQEERGLKLAWEEIEWDDPNVKNLVAQGFPPNAIEANVQSRSSNPGCSSHIPTVSFDTPQDGLSVSSVSTLA